VKFPTQIP